MKRGIKAWPVFVLVLALCLPAQAQPAEGGDLSVTILSPSVELPAMEKDNTLLIEAEAPGAEGMFVELIWDDGEYSFSAEADYVYQLVELEPIYRPITLIVSAFAPADETGQAAYVSEEMQLLTPRQRLIADMLLTAQENIKQKKYRFARAETDYDIGVCKNFVMRLFDENKGDLRMAAYPDVPLKMPLNNWAKDVAPYRYGIEWAPDTPQMGNCFDIVAAFRHDGDLSREENRQNARAFLENVQRGDFYQMVGDYVDGNGPHSLLFIADYDPADDSLHWTDSNMKGTRVDGERWGYMQYDRSETAEWMITAISRRNSGATLYRLREDLIYLPQQGE